MTQLFLAICNVEISGHGEVHHIDVIASDAIPASILSFPEEEDAIV